MEEEKSIIHWKPALPANYLQLTGVLPKASMELFAIKYAVNLTLDAVTQSEAALKNSYNKDAKIVAKIVCCFAYFNCGQQLAKLAQYYFFHGDRGKGFAVTEKAQAYYHKVEELHWNTLIRQYYDGRKIYRRRDKSGAGHSREELMEAKFFYHFEVVVIHFLYFHAMLEANSFFTAESGKTWLGHFLKNCHEAESINSTHTDLLFVKIMVLINFLHFQDKEIIREFFRATQAFIEHAALADKKRKQIVFIDSVLREMRKNSVSLSYRLVVPEALDDPNRHFFINVFLETAYGRLKNKDLLIFYPGFSPADLLVKHILIFDGIKMVFSIADFYKLLAHFRSITLRLQFTADPALNSRISQALLVADIIDAEGNFTEDLSEEDEQSARSALLSVYQDHFSKGVDGALMQTLSFKQLRENFLQQRAHVRALYDGFAPEKALFLVGRALEETRLTSLNPRSLVIQVIALIRTAFNYRHQLRTLLKAGVDFLDLANSFVTEILAKEKHTLMLQVTCPALVVEEDEWRHTVFVIFAKTPDSMRIQVINTGLGAEVFHQHEGQFFPREIEFLLNEGNILLLRQYVYALFGLMQQIADTQDAFTAALQVLYSLNAENIFVHAATPFLRQVTGNCAVFALQLALRNALNLSDEHYYQLILDIAKGCDVLATVVRAAPLAEDAVIPADVLYDFLDDTITFPCGYTSIPRANFRAPGAHITPLYIPAVGAVGIPGTNHHIIPQSYLQFLYDKLNAGHSALLAEVLGKPVAALTKRQFAYGFFDMFHGPRARADDPNNPAKPYDGLEKKRPKGFLKSRWSALQGIGQSLSYLLKVSTAAQYAALEPVVLINCLSHLMILKSDPSRTQVFSEQFPGQIWKVDSQDPSRYRLR